MFPCVSNGSKIISSSIFLGIKWNQKQYMKHVGSAERQLVSAEEIDCAKTKWLLQSCTMYEVE